YGASESLNCAGCLNNIGENDYVSALEQEWHTDCFRCSVCDCLLSTWYHEKGGLLFCQQDYWARFGEPCHHCQKVMTGPVMAAGTRHYHPECFACNTCGAPIDDKEPYAVQQERLYCSPCYARSEAGARALRVVRAPAPAAKLKDTEIDSSCGLLTLHIGDRILEINPPKPKDEPDRVPDTVIQLTIEPPETPMCNIQTETEPSLEGDGKKERLFKRKGDGANKRVIKRRQPSSPLLCDKEKSSSMSKLLDAVDGDPEPTGVLCDLSRARSFRAEPRDVTQRVFRACDLLQGELLGSGFFGEVYKVTHRETGEVMVLKQLYRLDEGAQRNFLKEVAVLRSLSHPNVLRFIGVLYRDKRLHLVTEYVAGGTLYSLIQDTSTELSWTERVRLARDVAGGVGYLHRMNVIHRDLNSHNCLVREDKTVIVADFGLARIVQRTASSSLERHSTLRRKRYTVVGNPYWMAPEMMNGNVYDEKVDVFSFGIILCEIIGRVSADPDFLPRRPDFGLNEPLFLENFCRDCPPPLSRVALLAAHLRPGHRPTFEVIEIWLETLLMHMGNSAAQARLLADIAQYAAGGAPSRELPGLHEVLKSPSTVTITSPPPAPGRALGKCVSASHIAAPPRVVTVTNLSRSHNTLHTPGYILRQRPGNIDITKVDDISEWLDPRPSDSPTMPAFLRNQSVEGLETRAKRDAPLPFCRHHSIPDHCQDDRTLNDDDSDSSDDDLEDITDWHRNVSTVGTSFKKVEKMEIDQPKTLLSGIVKKGENLLKKNSYDVTSVTLRNPDERKIPEVDCRRFNIDYLNKSPVMAVAVKNIQKEAKPVEKTGFFTKKLLSPKFSRLFKPNTAEVVRSKTEMDDKEEKSRSKFFIQRPASPSNLYRGHRVRPVEDTKDKKENHILKSDLKLASLGKPMTPIFRRHAGTERPDFADGRFSYRKPRDDKFIELGRNKIKAPAKPLTRCSPTNNVPLEVDKPEKRREGISRSNYVSLANLKINSKKEFENKREDSSPVERVI
ncbi:LIM domain kinase 1, partial [Cydia amplana]|uniref:LIM domain kinase 1 n=1 Tax=Cydia amplana TaxID=1869771 RepID=UPI002FE55382